MTMRTLGQKRAEYALKVVLNTKETLSESGRKEFKSFSAGSPTMILQNGFGQALAFWLSKATDKDLKIKPNDKHFLLFKMVMDWLQYEKGDVKNRFIKKTGSPTEFLEEISKMGQGDYLAAQKEALALLEWVKRFANADL